MHTLMTIFSQPPSNLRDPKLALWNSPWAMVTSGVRETSTADGRMWLKYTFLKSRNARCIHHHISIQEICSYFYLALMRSTLSTFILKSTTSWPPLPVEKSWTVKFLTPKTCTCNRGSCIFTPGRGTSNGMTPSVCKKSR